MSRSPSRTLDEPSACELIVWCASKASMMAYISGLLRSGKFENCYSLMLPSSDSFRMPALLRSSRSCW